MIGKKLLHYEITDKLGEGGMGEVYLARDTKLGREVALKVLPEEMYRDPERRQRFEREARVIAALNHPNIVTIYSVEEFEDRPFLTMELVRGKTLRDEITDTGLSLEKFFPIALALVDALSTAHAQSITHRDLKPANIMLSDEGRLKVLDFGLAKLFQDAASDEDAKTVGLDINTQEGRILGTVSYMSPEQVEGKALDGRSDIFSLGVVFYEMLTGRRPFVGDSNASTISAILRDTPQPVTEVRRSLPHHLGRIIRRCLAKDPDRRYQTAVDLRNDMQELVEEIDSGDIDTSTDTVMTSSAARPAPTQTQPISSDSIVLPGTKKTYRWVLGLIGVVVVAAIAMFMVKARTPGDTRTAPSTFTLGDDATLGVIGFENLSDPEDSDNLGRVLMGLVTTGLAESGGINVASTAKVLSARRAVGAGDRTFDASLAPEAARNAGANVMLVGQVIRDGERMILTAELVDVGSGNTLGSVKKQAASSSELFEMAGAIAQDVRKLMGVTAARAVGREDFDLAKSLTDSPEAYRQFTAGEVAVHQGQNDQAVLHFNQAIRIDSTFALAYLRLLLAHTWNGETDVGLAAAKEGLPYIDRLPQRWQTVYSANLAYYDGNAESAYDAMVRLVESSPDIPDAYNLLGEITTHYSKYTSSRRARECFERVLEIDPSFEVVLFHLVDEYIQFNDVNALKDLIAKYRAINPADPRVRNAELSLLYAQQRFVEVIDRIEDLFREGDLTRWTQLAASCQATGNWVRALEVAEDAVERREKGYNHAFALEVRATVHEGLGNIETAMADHERACQELKAMGRSSRWADSIVAHYRWRQTFTLTAVGAYGRAVTAAERGVVADAHSTWARYALVSAHLKAGHMQEADRAFADLTNVKAGNINPQDEFILLLAQAELEAARGNADGALEALRRVDAMPIETRNVWVQWWIEGEVKYATGDIAGAVASYAKVFGPSSYLVPSNFEISTFRIPIHYKFARALEETGNVAEAKQHYRAYLDRWGNADMVIPNVEDARKRLKALELM